MDTKRTRITRQAGLTLLELAIVLVVTAVLAATAAPRAVQTNSARATRGTKPFRSGAAPRRSRTGVSPANGLPWPVALASAIAGYGILDDSPRTFFVVL